MQFCEGFQQYEKNAETPIVEKFNIHPGPKISPQAAVPQGRL